MPNLLAQFRTADRTHADTLFAEIVRTHIDLAYSVARRCVRDAHLAEDITQAVFMILAEKARKLPASTNLPGWIFRTTQYVAANAHRSLDAAKTREQKYAQQHPEFAETHMNDFEPLAALEHAMAHLSKSDQDAIIAKYYRDESWEQIGTSLGLSEDAARKRVERSLAKLRQYLPASAAGAAIPALSSGKALLSAPATLSATVITNFTTHAAAHSTALSLAQGALQMMKHTQILHTSLVAAAVIVVAGTVTLFATIGNYAHADQSAPAATVPAAEAAPDSAQTPLEAAYLLASYNKSGDEEGIKRIINSQTPQEKQVVDLQAHMVHQIFVLQQSVNKALGNTAAKDLIPLEGPLVIPSNATEKIDGDNATVTIDGAPIPMIKINGEWKLAYHAIAMANLPVSSDTLIQWNKDLITAIDSVTAEVDNNTLTNVKAVNARLIEQIQAVSRKLQDSLTKPATQAK